MMETLRLAIMILGSVVASQGIILLIFYWRIVNLEHDLRTHGHGVIYKDEYGNEIRKTDAAGNQVTYD